MSSDEPVYHLFLVHPDEETVVRNNVPSRERLADIIGEFTDKRTAEWMDLLEIFVCEGTMIDVSLKPNTVMVQIENERFLAGVPDE